MNQDNHTFVKQPKIKSEEQNLHWLRTVKNYVEEFHTLL